MQRFGPDSVSSAVACITTSIRRFGSYSRCNSFPARRCLLSTFGLLFASTLFAETPRKPVTDDYFGTKVVDDYRWLEAGDDSVVQQWSDDQNARARSYLDALPGRDRLKQRLTELLTFEAPSWFDVIERHGALFAMKQQPPKAQPMLVRLGSLDSLQGERVVLDPLAFDSSGETAMDFAVPSLDDKYVAVSLSRKGSERGDVHVFEVASGRELKADFVPAVNSGTAGGSVAWTTSGFFYTRHPLPGERPPEDLGFFQQVYFHTLGTPTSSDQYALGKDFLRSAENFLSTSRDGEWAADLVEKGDGGQYELFVRGPNGSWTKVANYEDRVVQVQFGWDKALYLLSRKDAPNGKILRLPLDPGKLALAKAKVIVPEQKGSIQLHHKQNCFDDFIASARWLVAHKYTSPEKLAIEGGSNGGLLMGAVLTQAPELFRAVVAYVGYYDMLRFEAAPNGVFNTTEYGSVKNPDDFKVLAAYSPYHHVKADTQYPAVLFMTGKNDPRVDPFHSRKMVARLQATATRQPVLLRTADTGHGIGTPLAERIAQSVDVHCFLFQQLGMEAKSMAP